MTQLGGFDPTGTKWQREAMVADQLAARGLTDQRVLSAMNVIPREHFIPAQLREHAYLDGALPIGDGQTISQPYTVAFMCEALHTTPTDRILEIGTGSGYGAAVLSQLAKEVHTIERIPELADAAAEKLRQLGINNVFVHIGDGTLGLPEAGPFDGIIVTAGGEQLPRCYVQQLKDGGRIVIPLGETMRQQSMCRFTRQRDNLYREDLGSFAFVPLIGAEGWHVDEAMHEAERESES
ncbi:MAG: protein-L-isoaspartate(D-aspartate) O-methyltransferase [Planctomycetaceae bacterium]|nr:protein-L-isoaspartate(D-aspartate) O-methyltransferase [Planctomycetaceae bacterium]